MNGHIPFLILAICLGTQTGLESIPLDLLPVWAKPIVATLLTIVTFYGGYLKGLVSLPAGMVQVPTKTLDNLSTAAEAAAVQPASPRSDPPIGGALVVLLAAGLMTLGACATIEAETPQQQLFALQHQYLAAINEAAAYEARPRCGFAGAPDIGCSDPATVATLRRADDATDAALQVARASPSNATLATASAAIKGFRAALLESLR